MPFLTCISTSCGRMGRGRKKSNAFALLFVLLFRLLGSFLRGLNEGGEGLRVVDGELGEHLAVDRDAALLEAIHEFGIADVVETAGRVDAADPELTEVALDQAAGDVSVAIGVEDLLFGGLEEKMLRTEVTFRFLKDSLPAGTGNGATFNSSHGVSFLLLLRDDQADSLVVRLVDEASLAELSLLFVGFVRGEVAFVGMLPLDLAGASHFDALHQSAFRLHFGHSLSPLLFLRFRGDDNAVPFALPSGGLIGTCDVGEDVDELIQ